MKLPQKLREAREKASLTQQEASSLTGYSVSAIQKFESGRRTPPARSIAALLIALEGYAKP